VRHGFLLEFDEKPDVDISDIEQYVKRRIAEDVPVSFHDETHIAFGDKLHYCTGPRMHVRSTGEIEGFSMLHEIKYDPMARKYLLVGLVGGGQNDDGRDLNRISFDKTRAACIIGGHRGMGKVMPRLEGTKTIAQVPQARLDSSSRKPGRRALSFGASRSSPSVGKV
jgi:hypothetical protein